MYTRPQCQIIHNKTPETGTLVGYYSQEQSVSAYEALARFHKKEEEFKDDILFFVRADVITNRRSVYMRQTIVLFAWPMSGGVPAVADGGSVLRATHSNGSRVCENRRLSLELGHSIRTDDLVWYSVRSFTLNRCVYTQSSLSTHYGDEGDEEV